MFEVIIWIICGTLTIWNICTPNGLLTSMLITLCFPIMLGGGDIEQAIKKSPFAFIVTWLGFSAVTAFITFCVFG